MAKEQLVSFLEFVQKDSTLQEKLTQSADATAFAAIAANAGFADVSPELVTDFFEFMNAQQNTLDQEDELSAVTGGVGSPAQSKLQKMMASMTIDMLTESAKGAYAGATSKGFNAIDAAGDKLKSKLINN